MSIIEKNTHLEKNSRDAASRELSLEELKQRVRELEEQVEKKRLKDRIKSLEDELNDKNSRYSPYWLSDEEKDKMKESDKYLHGHSTFKDSLGSDGIFRNAFGMPMPRTWQEFDWLTKFYS